MDAAQIASRFQKAEQERNIFEPIFDDAIRLTMPGRARFTYNAPDDAATDIFDETGANAVAEFVSRMQAGICPPFSNFLRLEASSLVEPADRDAVNRDLDEIAQYAFEEIWASNFAQESAESFYDLSISTGLMHAEDGPRGLVNRAVPITEFYIERAGDDAVGGVFRKMKRKASEIPDLYRHARLTQGMKTHSSVLNEADRDLTVIEYTRRNWPERHDAFEHYVLVQDHKEIIVNKSLNGTGSNPFIPFRWGTAAGEAWGRGPVMTAMGAIRTTNLMVEMVLENAAMSIVGMYQTDNDGVVNSDTINLLPGTILTKELGTQGLEPIQMATGNFNMQDVVLNDQRLNIKRALFNDMLADPGKTPATAYEVSERMADLAYRTSSSFSRVFYEFLVPYMRRVLYILEKRGDIKMPVKNGRGLTFRATSPLAQAQHGRELQQLMADFQIRSTLQGPLVAAGSYDMAVLHPWLQKRTGMDERLYKSADQIMKDMKEGAALMAQMQAQQAGGGNGQT